VPTIKVTVTSKVNVKTLFEDLKREVDKAVHTGAILIKAEAVKQAPSDLSNLANSIEVFEESSGDKIIYRVVAQAEYAKAVEYGSKPHTPPLDAILEWGKRRGMTQEQAYYVWKAIRKYGTRPHPYMAPSFHMYEDIVVDLVKKAVKGVV
jgi:hypothetical protein